MGLGPISAYGQETSGVQDTVIYRVEPAGRLSVSRDRAASWQDLPAPILGRGVARLVPDPANDSILYLADRSGALWHSRDGGVTWDLLGSMPEPLEASGSVALAASSADPATLWYAGRGLWRFALDTRAWELVLQSDGSARFTAVAVSASDSDLVIAGDERGKVFSLKNSSGAVTEIRVEEALVQPGAILFLGFDPGDEHRRVAVFRDAAGADGDGLIWVSSDNGNAWRPLALTTERTASASAAAAANNCTPTFSPAAYTLTAAAQTKTALISFRRARNPQGCYWYASESTMGTLTILSQTHTSGPYGGGTVTFKVTENRSGDARNMELLFHIRTSTSGPWPVKGRIPIRQRAR
jgi:hypothetical protein